MAQAKMQAPDYTSLHKLEMEYQQVAAWLSAPGRGTSRQELGAILKLLDGWLTYLSVYEPLAQSQMIAGQPYMHDRLVQMRKDIEGATSIFGGMYQDALDFEKHIAQIEDETRRAWRKAIDEANGRWKEVFESTQEARNRLLRS